MCVEDQGGDHLSTINNGGCSYAKLSCPFNIRCHIKELCPKRSVICIHCNLSGDHQFIVGDHTDQCPCYPLLCPQGCKQSVIRKDLESHVDTCPLEPVSCPFSEFNLAAELEFHVNIWRNISRPTCASSHD